MEGFMAAIVVFTINGAARQRGTSEARSRQLFKAGIIPTEYLIDGRRPAVSPDTLKKVDAKLKAAKRKIRAARASVRPATIAD
jgi:hypothetical protein